MTGKTAGSVLDDKARLVVDELYRRSRGQMLPAAVPMLLRAVRTRLRTGGWDTTQSPEGKAWLADKLVALEPQKAALCYLLCRSIGARRVVEAGTSYGLSTIYLASAVRDAVTESADGEQLGAGLVVGTEHEPGKVAAARANLQRAGLDDWVDVREGDLRETLIDLDRPVDFMLVDVWIPMALPALKLVTPKLRAGALVVCDNVVSGRRQYADYLAYVRDPKGPFRSVTVPGQGGLEISLKKTEN
ncbi:O-methyltransferase [Pseudonocardia endophytica]|uniref:Putative O-methyltransferase YrrM n=1 Tax=Pseudonocardia endophytica TaxID=401976 RepID=A0A4R1I007_PSEEN|nr:class I SAM-dependent methyltransferase [Pseudonocardia endophytica]TCK27173.1 putative O-methyltransferase YrrM [Pseudonocardia endophytica]